MRLCVLMVSSGGALVGVMFLLPPLVVLLSGGALVGVVFLLPPLVVLLSLLLVLFVDCYWRSYYHRWCYLYFQLSSKHHYLGGVVFLLPPLVVLLSLLLVVVC